MHPAVFIEDIDLCQCLSFTLVCCWLAKLEKFFSVESLLLGIACAKCVYFHSLRL